MSDLKDKKVMVLEDDDDDFEEFEDGGKDKFNLDY